MHINTVAKIIIDRYRKREDMLFAYNSDHTIPRTNKGTESFFMKKRRNIRKRMGSSVTRNILSQNGEKTALFQNSGNGIYLQAVYGTKNREAAASAVAKYRKSFKGKDSERDNEVG